MARNASDAMVATEFNGTTWTKPASIGGRITSAPNCVSFTAGKLLCAARDTDGGVTSVVLTGTTAGKFLTIKGQTIAAPSCAQDDAKHVICTVNSTTGALLAAQFSGTAWSELINIAGTATSETDCSNLQIVGEVACFARGTESALYGNLFKGGSFKPTQWIGWSSLGGLVASRASCTSDGAGQILCGVVATEDSALYVDQYANGGWSGFAKVGSLGIGNPSCTTLATNKVLCVMVGVNNEAISTVGP